MLITSSATLLITTSQQHPNLNINLEIPNLVILKVLYILQTNFLKIQKSVEITYLFLSNKKRRYQLNGQLKCLPTQLLKANQISTSLVKILLHRILNSQHYNPLNTEAKHLLKKMKKIKTESLIFHEIINSKKILVFIHLLQHICLVLSKPSLRSKKDLTQVSN